MKALKPISLNSKYGPWAIVTGASSGIGREVAILLGSSGFNLVLVARRKDKLEALSEELKKASTIDTVVLPLDLAKEDSLQQLARATSALEVGLLVAAAGFGTSGPFLEGEATREKQMLRLNCESVLDQCLHFGEKFASRGGGGIVLFGSILGFQGTPFSAHYAATKAYNQSLAEGLHVEMKSSGVDVIASAPGPTETEFASSADMTMSGAMSPHGVARETLRALGRRSTAIPGFQTKFLSYSLAMLPRWMRVRIMGAVMSGMTNHHG
ncbi:MAG: SDR family oxidoreductase [Verrucomicrobiota bacterium]